LHPVWSVDARAWISASELVAGARLTGLSGEAILRTMLPRDIEPVYNIEVDADHCYRVGQQGLLVHNASCPEQSVIIYGDTTRAMFRGVEYERASGVTATIVKGFQKGTPFGPDFPKWWYPVLDFVPKNKALSPVGWRKGHLLPRNLGGAGRSEKRNLGPMTYVLNQSSFSPCEKRIAEVVENCGCVFFSITVNYNRTDTDQLLIPSGFDLKVTLPSGATLIDITIENTSDYQVWSDCRKTT
jgi:hypothetical protein